ncbi:MAG: hypothetical protein KDF64_10475, partial [Geminicoccaceae bacterium]|nr:hypothetical protein [Geminicoccaceae bacterium]
PVSTTVCIRLSIYTAKPYRSTSLLPRNRDENATRFRGGGGVYTFRLPCPERRVIQLAVLRDKRQMTGAGSLSLLVAADIFSENRSSKN